MAVYESIRPDTKILDDYGFDWSWAFVVFRGVPGHPKITVGSNGVVWSQKRGGSVLSVDGWRRIGHGPGQYGYETGLLPAAPGRPKHVYSHHLVLIAFVSPKPEGKVCRHMDGNGMNNALDNLRWGTQYENIQDRVRHGTGACGEKMSAANANSSGLRVTDISEMREMKRQGFSVKDISRKFHVSQPHASVICNGKSWKCVPMDY